MNKGYICIAGKNSIAIAGLSYVLDKYSADYVIYALCDANDVGVDYWQPSFKKFAIKSGVEVVQIETLYPIENLCFISLEYHRLIVPERFKTNNLFNIHFSLLPAYKGMYTSAHPILNDEKTTGCSIHRIDSGIDTGEIISQIAFSIASHDNCKDIYEKYLLNGRKLTYSTIDSLILDNFKSKKQATDGASYYSKKSINYSNLVVDFSHSALNVSAQLRAYTFRDYQLPTVEGFQIFGHSITDTPSKGMPGAVLESTENYLKISTKDFDMLLFIDKSGLLIDAVSGNNKEKVIHLLKSSHFALNEKDQRGWTPLIISSFNGYNDITELLLESGSDPNKTNPKGTTPLMYAKDHALRTGDLYGMIRLLEYGAQKNLEDIFRKTIYDYLDPDSEYFKDVCTLLA